MKRFLDAHVLGLIVLMCCAVSLAQAATPDANVRFVITNGGVDVKGNGQVHYHQGGHDGPVVAWGNSGETEQVPAGTYDVEVTFSDGAANKQVWIDNQTFAGKVDRSIEMGMKLTDVRYTITNAGVDVKDNGQVHYHQGGHDGSVVAWARSGETQRMPAGTYDVEVTFSDGAASKQVWIDNQTFAGKVDRSIEVGVKLADVRYTITNAGVDVKDNGQVHYHQGGHAGSVVAWANSGESQRMPAGTYDVEVTFSDGAASKQVWIDNQTFAGKVDRSIEVGVKLTDVRYTITNGGVDVKSNGQVHYHQGGHAGSVVAWANSGESQRMPAGTYDVEVTFSDGAATKQIWIDNQTFAGKVDKTVEIGVKTADVTYVITNGGIDQKNSAQIHYHQGDRNGAVIAWSNSGEMQRLPAGVFAAEITFDQGLVHKQLWLDNLNFSGVVQKAVELKLVLAQPVVSVTENGADQGDKANVDYFVPGTPDSLGGVKSKQQAVLERGTYDIRATIGAAEGWLRTAALSGQPHLSIAVKKPTVQTLTAGASPLKACRIEVYGVNFDFNKAKLRPESDPVLHEVLALFTGTPSFSAEVSGHTDNVGTPAYNLKLSDARASAVNTWLVSHGVDGSRVASRGYGDTQPLVPNTTDENRFKNRRVELRRMNCD